MKLYPDIIKKSDSLGKTYMGEDIHVYKLSLSSKEDLQENFFDKRKSVLITGAHHAREPASYYLPLYTMIMLIREYTKGNSEVSEILSTINVYIVPIVNLDGVNYICQNFITSGFVEIRKNRNSAATPKCSTNDVGIDLNRNYDISWDINNIGSSPIACSEDYRGPGPFSESETKAIKIIVESNQITEKTNLIRYAFNYHAFGNMAIIPPNYLKEDSDNYMKYNFEANYIIYQDILTRGMFPSHVLIGNGYKTVK